MYIRDNDLTQGKLGLFLYRTVPNCGVIFWNTLRRDFLEHSHISD